jgi:hypothetical protein
MREAAVEAVFVKPIPGSLGPEEPAIVHPPHYQNMLDECKRLGITEEEYLNRANEFVKRKAKQIEKEKKQKYQITTLADIENYPDHFDLIENILIAETSYLFVAKTGNYKTWILGLIARAIATGLPLFGQYKINQDGPVLILDNETPYAEAKRRKGKLGLGNDLPIYFLHHTDIKIDTDEGMAALQDIMEEIKPVLVILDPLVRFHSQEENSATGMALVMGNLRKIANTGRTLITSHHYGKGDGPLSDRARGSSDIIAGVDMEYAITKKYDDVIFQSVKARMKDVPAIKLSIAEDEQRFDFESKGEVPQEEVDIKIYLREILKTELPLVKIRGYIEDEGYRIGQHRLREILKEMEGIKIGNELTFSVTPR